MEACPGSQWLARKLIEIGHDARIIPGRFVKAYVKSNKTDTVDAAAIAEAVTRPTMRFVQVRTQEQVDLQALHRIRDKMIRNRTGLMNQARAFCLEYGLAMRVGASGFRTDIRRHLDAPDNDLTAAMRLLLRDLLDDLDHLEKRIGAPKFISKTAKQLISFMPKCRKCDNTGGVRPVLAGSGRRRGRVAPGWFCSGRGSCACPRGQCVSGCGRGDRARCGGSPRAPSPSAACA
uniref:Transposase, IS111A/IS1328/IS1533 n=1 Tax=Cereibacter sphaeroides (strain ATCC 17025 / ATH 2.4.3) TaxID=349102 RepID=A4WSG3_CERS5